MIASFRSSAAVRRFAVAFGATTSEAVDASGTRTATGSGCCLRRNRIRHLRLDIDQFEAGGVDLGAHLGTQTLKLPTLAGECVDLGAQSVPAPGLRVDLIEQMTDGLVDVCHS